MMIAMADTDCQLDSIYDQWRNKPLHTAVKGYLDEVNWEDSSPGD